MDDVERVHLKHQPVKEKVLCRDPICESQGLILNCVNQSKNHVEAVHGIKLRSGKRYKRQIKCPIRKGPKARVVGRGLFGFLIPLIACFLRHLEWKRLWLFAQ